MAQKRLKEEFMNSPSSIQQAGTVEVQAGMSREVVGAEFSPSFPIYFDSDEHTLFGWFQGPPARSLADVGLVICKPFGYEAICAHRSLRAFADAAARLGVPSLRVDYLGTGDSGPIDPEADQVKVWTRDVSAAAAELRRRTGVRQICLLGVRLGALLAILAADECGESTPLALISPIVSGRRHLRDLRTTRLAALMGKDASFESHEASLGSMEVSGFTLSAATLNSLAQVDLKARAAPAASAVLMLDGKSMPVAAAWAKHLSDLGVRITYAALPGLIEMIMTSPQSATVPLEMVAAFETWLRDLISSVPARTNAGYSPCRAAASELMKLSGDEFSHRDPLTERPLFFGDDSAVFGIVTEPRPGEIRRRAVIMLNAGADVHEGVNGMHVTLARRWADRGYVVLRMDLAGLGDSRTHSGQAANVVFPETALDDIRAALQLLRNRYAVGDVTLFGLCSGAYHALRAAAAGLPANRILMVNPQNYFWKSGMTLDDLQVAEVVRNPVVYRQRLSSWAAWKRLMTGKVDVTRIAKIYMVRPLLALGSSLRDAARWTGIRLKYDLGRELEEIDARGVKIVFVFARDEPGIDLLKIEAGSSLRRLGERCRMRIIDDADHVFSQSGPRAALQDILSEELFARTTAGNSPAMATKVEKELLG
jgi:alpha-beta hydrolase superfamily lysophospholipase